MSAATLTNLTADYKVADLKLAVQQAPSALKQFHLAWALTQVGDKDAAARAWASAEEMGLKAAQVPPLEQTDYERLARRMERR